MSTDSQINGFFNVRKDKGMTSFDVCQKIKKLFQTPKVGHSGTLDPNAVGVMQIAVGKATKLLPILDDHKKTYLATVMFGILTETLDPEGEVIEKRTVNFLNLEAIDKAIDFLKKEKNQIPPIYSAIKVNGKKLYEYARAKEEIELKPRPVTIYEAKRTTDIYYENGQPMIKVRLTVSKGFYVRSFVRDLAAKLDTIAIMSDLTREAIEDYKLENSISLEDISIENLISIEETFKDYPKFYCKDYLVKLIKNGITLDERQIESDTPFLVYHNDKLLAIYAPYEKNKYKIVQYLGD